MALAITYTNANVGVGWNKLNIYAGKFGFCSIADCTECEA